MIPYFPLANGLLTGKYRRGADPPSDSRLGSGSILSEVLVPRLLTDANLDVVEGLDSYAREHGHSLLELAFSWLTSQPVVATVIAGVTLPDQVRANAAAASWDLEASDFEAIESIVRGSRA